MVLVPSLGTELSIWRSQAAELSDRRRVVCCDLRGHGRSPVPPGPYSISELGADLLAVLDRLELQRASLCGISIGGMSSMWVAAHAPERVERLIVCCSSARIDTGSRYTERARAVRKEGLAAVADGVLERWFTSAFAAAAPDVVQRFRRALVGTPQEGYAGCCEALAALDLRGELPSIQAPTLVIAGGQDRATPREHSELIAAAIPDSRLELVEDAAHLANVEQPEAVGALIEEHLS